MTRTSTLVTAIFLLWTGAICADEKQPLRQGALEGVWKLVSVELNGQPLSMEKLQDSRLTVQGPKYSFKLGDIRLEMTHVMHPDKQPQAMEMTIVEGSDKGKTFHAIYKLDGNTLTICRHSQPDMPRPTEFGTKPDSGLLLIVWSRDKS